MTPPSSSRSIPALGLGLLLCLGPPALARPIADPQSLVLEGSPDFTHPGQAEFTLKNTGPVPVRLLGVETSGPLGLAGAPELNPIGPGKTRGISLEWAEPTGGAPQLLVRTPGGTAVLPRTASGTAAPTRRAADAGESAVLLEGLPRLVYCYQQAVSLDPTIEGFVEAEFTIAPDGSVSSAAILNTTLQRGSTEACLVSRLLELRFAARPPTGGADVVKYPFSFVR